jgi:hypothetical protein
MFFEWARSGQEINAVVANGVGTIATFEPESTSYAVPTPRREADFFAPGAPTEQTEQVGDETPPAPNTKSNTDSMEQLYAETVADESLAVVSGMSGLPKIIKDTAVERREKQQ